MKGALRVAVLVVLAAGVALLARFTPLGGWIEDGARTLGRFAGRPWAPPAWIAAYAAAIALGAPGTLMTVTGGVAFGFPGGVILNLAGGTLGAALAFLEGRYLARDWMDRHLGRWAEKLGPLAEPRRAFFTFLRLRLIPLVPANALNFAAGLTRAPLGAYLAGSALGFVPSTTVYTYFAHALASGGMSGRSAALDIAVVLGAIMLLVCLPTVLKLSRRSAR